MLQAVHSFMKGKAIKSHASRFACLGFVSFIHDRPGRLCFHKRIAAGDTVRLPSTRSPFPATQSLSAGTAAAGPAGSLESSKSHLRRLEEAQRHQRRLDRSDSKFRLALSLKRCVPNCACFNPSVTCAPSCESQSCSWTRFSLLSTAQGLYSHRDNHTSWLVLAAQPCSGGWSCWQHFCCFGLMEQQQTEFTKCRRLYRASQVGQHLFGSIRPPL